MPCDNNGEHMFFSKMSIRKILFFSLLLSNADVSAYDYKTGVSPPIPDMPGIYGSKAPGAPVFPVVHTERAAICLAEAMLNTLSAYISSKGCATAAGTYYLNINVKYDGKGAATLSGAAVNQITWFKLRSTLVDPTSYLGMKCNISTPKTGLSIIQNIPLRGYQGLYSWNDSGTILIGDVTHIGIDKVSYEDRVSKNFYALDVDPATGKPTYIPTGPDGASLIGTTPANANWGMETLIKHPFNDEKYAELGYPRSTWWQRSLYWDGGSVQGGLQIVKNRLYPSACQMELNIWGYDFPDSLDENGTVTISLG